jgi:YjjG family noncanonical pyrimidine nucleotidase
MNQYTWLLFDADGTLFDYDAAERTALERTFHDVGIPFEPICLTTYRKINGQIWIDFEKGKITAKRLKSRRFELLFHELQHPVDAKAFSDQYLLRLSEATYLMDGAEKLVKHLEDSYRIGIITNGLTNVQRPRFKASAVAPYIETTVISEELGVAKPDPRIFDAAFEQMQHPSRDEVMIIGDSLTSDMQGGYNYGIDTCWFNPKNAENTFPFQPTYEIHALADILNILPERNTI